MKIKRLLTNVCSPDLESSKHFYTSLFQLNVEYHSDWFIHLVSDGREFELGIIAEGHEIVPEQTRGKVSGAYLTFVVEDVDVVHRKAQELGCDISQAPQITFYGQKRMLVVAPEGTVCDVSSPATPE